MNKSLQRLFSVFWNPEYSDNENGGASSVEGTTALRHGIQALLEKYQIRSMFDAGCNECTWIKLIAEYVKYQGGDISLAMVANAWKNHPELDIILYDVTTDPVPPVDLLFVRDVAIHLNDSDKQKLWRNWFDSDIPWILTTHCRGEQLNENFEYADVKFPFAAVNWEIQPWNFPEPTDIVNEYALDGRCLALWHRDQFKGIL